MEASAPEMEAWEMNKHLIYVTRVKNNVLYQLKWVPYDCAWHVSVTPTSNPEADNPKRLTPGEGSANYIFTVREHAVEKFNQLVAENV